MKVLSLAFALVACIQLSRADCSGGGCPKARCTMCKEGVANTAVTGVASYGNKGCDAVAAYLSLYPDIPDLCLFMGMTACTADQMNASQYDWGQRSKDEIIGPLAAMSKSFDTNTWCLKTPYVCPAGNRFTDISAYPNYGHCCYTYTCDGTCPSGYFLGTDPSFVIRGGIDSTQELYTALGYASGGKYLHELCIMEIP